ncbi:hypothetical protein [Nereida sp.]|uniref:hypothetical protein n=1 Tax=Nereida sp. TaxID=2736090 RepID=UPI003F696998
MILTPDDIPTINRYFPATDISSMRFLPHDRDKLVLYLARVNELLITETSEQLDLVIATPPTENSQHVG